MDPLRPSRGERFFRSLLRVFPPEFRGEFGGEMEGVFREQRREALTRRGGMLQLWWETLTGIFRTAPAEHLEMLRQDGGYTLRMIRKNPGFTALVVLVLALGIGANTAVFSLIHGVLLRPLPYASSDRLVMLHQQAPHAGYTDVPFSVPEILDYRSRSRSLDALVEYHNMPFDLLGQGEPKRVETGVVSANFFDVLGMAPILGRTFVAADDEPGAPPVLVLSYEYWKRAFGGDSGIVDRTVRMNDKVHTIVGVLPPMPQYPDENDVYMPTSACPFRSSPQLIADRGSRMMQVFGRLRSGVTLGQAQAELDGIARRIQQAHPKEYPAKLDYGVRAALLERELTQRARPTFLVLFATTALVLLIVCANVANLSLSRWLRREREMAIRATLGAGRARLLRQMVTESTIVSLAGGALGVWLAWGSLDLLQSFAERFTPRAREIHLDTTVLLFSFGLALATGLLFGSVPALGGTENLAAPLKEGGGRGAPGTVRRRLRSLLIVAQVALSFALLAGAGLALRSFFKLTRVDAGFHAENVVSMLIDLDWKRYDSPIKRDAFHQQLLERVNRIPSVVASAVTLTFPLNEMEPIIGDYRIEGRPHEPGEPNPTFDFRSVSPDYFRTLGIPLERGRLFTDADREDAPPVAIVNQALAERDWLGSDVVGRRISFDEGKHWVTIVGVVGNVRQYGLDRAVPDELYAPQAQRPSRTTTLLVRAAGDPAPLIRQLTAIVYAIDAEQPVAHIRTLEQVRSRWLAPPRLTGMLLGLFAAIALVITAAGIAGVMGLSVSQRLREIAIRMALGASRSGVLRMILHQGLTMVVVGLAAGLGLALAGTRLMRGILFGIAPDDPLTLLGVALVLLAAAGAACYFPARRATSVNPVETLRSE